MRTWRRALQLIALLALSSNLMGAGCNNDPANPAFEPPLRVIFTLPGPLAQLEDNSPINISIDFNRRVPSLGEMTLLLVPPPDSTDDPILSRSKLNITWPAVATQAGSGAQHLMIYGPEMLAPEILVWLTADPPPNSWIKGVLNTGSADRRVDFSVLFALDAAGGFDPQNPVTFESETPLAFAKPFELEEIQAEGNYQFSRLDFGTDVYVVAIHDTNGDGRLSPLDDWWGYFKDATNPLQAGVVTAYPLPLNPGDPEVRGDVHITLGPPFDPGG